MLLSSATQRVITIAGANSKKNISIRGFSWNDELIDMEHVSRFPQIAVVHKLIQKKKDKFLDSDKSSYIRRILSGYDLIISGDNHQQFNDKPLYNVGCFIRQRASEASYSPRLIAWRPGHIQEVLIPHDPDVITREHIEITEERKNRLEAFIQRIEKTMGVESKEKYVDFEENITKRMKKIKDKRVRRKIKEALDG